MIFPLSLICAFGLVTACIVICIVNAVPWYFIILLSLATLIVVVALFCVLVMILLLTLGKKYAKTYNPKDKKRWFFMIDVARFSCFWLGVKVKVNRTPNSNGGKLILEFYTDDDFQVIYRKLMSDI